MKIKIIIWIIFTFLVNTSFAKKNSNIQKSHKLNYKKKINTDDAKEFCLINRGASIDDSALKKCIDKVQATGEIDGKKFAPLRY